MRLWLATAIFALTALPALAEKADRTKPLNYEADTGECDDLKQVCVLVGNVVLNKGTMRAVGERVQVRKDPEGYQYGVIVAAPGKLASFRQRRDSSKPGLEEFVEGYAERIEYDEKEDTVKLTTRARVVSLTVSSFSSYSIRSAYPSTNSSSPGLLLSRRWRNEASLPGAATMTPYW